MQYVNDDDMDELFKRAAENYPLDTKSADWNKVLAALQGQTKTKTVSENKRNRNGRLLWLLLLLPLGLICNQLYSPGTLNNNGTSKATAGNETRPPATNNIQQENNDGSNVTRSNTVHLTNIHDERLNDKKEIGNTLEPLFVQQQKISYQSKFNHLKKDANGYSSNDISPANEVAIQDYNGNDGFMSEETSYHRSYVTGIAFSKVLGEAPPAMVNRIFNPSIHSPEQNSQQPVRVSGRKKFYGGLIGGIDATTVKFQKIESPGMTYGVLLGYQLNKKWSIETGLYSEKKYYYSRGEYFNTSKIYPPPSNARVDDVSGDCKMFEIPVSVKYNFSRYKNSGWFVTAGTSSYFMKKETYSYNVYYGSAGPYPHQKRVFKNSSNNLFTAISLSGGYTHRLGNVADLRVEPYLKLPISGIGIGDLPLFSTGLQVGLTRKF